MSLVWHSPNVLSVPELCRCKMWFPIFVWTNFPEIWENSLTWWYTSYSRLICTAGCIFVIVAEVLKFEKNMPHTVLMYRPKRWLTKQYQLRIVKLTKQNKNKFFKLIFSGIADVLYKLCDCFWLQLLLWSQCYFGCSCRLYAVMNNVQLEYITPS